MKNIRNFCIIAHIDHGKSTLADRLLDYTGSVTDREKQNQLLDNMDLERERGITIKSHAIQMDFKHNGEDYILNLIDTPGHVDFSYEVSRSIAACEGALLIVDAAQSIQAQTISNLYLALENDLEIIPILNKVDLPSANPEEVTDDIVDLLGCDPEEVIHASGKTGFGVDNILAAIIDRIPAPEGDPEAPLQALIFDSVYNSYRGIETYFRILNGEIKKGQRIKFMATNNEYFADEVGTLKLNQVVKKSVKTGDVGYLITGIKTAKEVKVGDTITDAQNPTTETIDGFEETFAVNHLAYFSLTNLLIDKLKESESARIINISSGAHQFVKRMNFDDIQSEKNYKPFKVYSYSKLANILFTRKLSEILKDDNITVNCLHPGVVATGFASQNDSKFQKFLFKLSKPFMRSSNKGAETSIYLSSSDDVSDVSGKYFYNSKVSKISSGASNEEDTERLWRISMELTELV